MKITKEGFAAAGETLSEQELAEINRWAKKPLTAEEVFTFSLILCDNEVDRDFESFSEDTLTQLGELFVGKTGISDHEWKSGNQIARIYRTQVQREPEKTTALGEEYVCLRAWAYMLRTEANRQLIADIEGGIKKEVSVGCAVGESRCSVCGELTGTCEHIRGQEYGGRLCCGVLSGAVDAYEWSFVAVPAQRNAGVVKGFDVSKGLRGFVESETGRALAGEFETLQKQAALGRAYEKQLRSEVLRLSLVCDRTLHKSLTGAVEHMDAGALAELRSALEKKAAEKIPLATQLPGLDNVTRFDGGAYIV